jgi:uncharacterized protein (TIGR00645 family)
MHSNKWVKAIETIIFNVRWLLIMFYLGLVAVLFMYCYAYSKQIFHIVISSTELTTEHMMLLVLEAVDVC